MSPRKYDRRSRLAAAEETRRRIVGAAAGLHAEHGALGTTHEMIARRAGVSIPTVYKYFPSRDRLIPACTGLALAGSPVRLDGSLFEGREEVPERLRALARGVFELYEYLAPWLRWSARDAAELPALREFLDEAEAGRAALLRAALSPGFDRAPPRRLLALGSVLLDYPSWRRLTASGFTSGGAAAVVAEALVTFYSESRKEKKS